MNDMAAEINNTEPIYPRRDALRILGKAEGGSPFSSFSIQANLNELGAT